MGGNEASDLEAGVRRTEQPDVVEDVANVADGLGNEIRLRAVDLIDVQVRNLNVSVDGSREPPWASLAAARSWLWRSNRKPSSKIILNDITAKMPSGSLTAIMGGSGSGKTTLLDAMSKRIHGSLLHCSGLLTYNEKTELLNIGTAAEFIGAAYVKQQDILLPTLTVRETLQYAVDLRLPSHTTKKERRAVVEDVIRELGLKECAATRIGDGHGGCSGGEKRRTSIGVQLLANQSVLFLDEPTTGLDATSAFQLVKTLKNLANKGRTIIMTIHQPRSEIWGLLDHVVLLTRGSLAYSGPKSECIPHFEQMGHKLLPFVNPGEFVVDIAAVDTRSQELESASVARVNNLTYAWKMKSSQSTEKVMETQALQHQCKTKVEGFLQHLWPLLREIRVLTRRTFKVTCRDRLGLLAAILEAISMGIMSGWIFLKLGSDLAGIRSREGALYSAAALQGYLVLLFETYRLTVDIEVFDRERSEGVVSVPGFIISRRLARFLIEDLPVPFLYSVIFYFMAGFRSDAGQFLTFFAVVLLSQYIAVNLAMVCVAVSRDFLRASLVANLSFTLQSLACGFFVNVENIAVWLRWTKWTAYVYYAFSALCENEFRGQFYNCPSPGGPSESACKQYTGDYILASLGFRRHWFKQPILILLGFTISFFILATFILQFKKTEIEVSRAQTTDADHSATTVPTTVTAQIKTVTIQLDKCSLDIETRNTPWQKTAKSTLKPITTTFEPGVLNVIMGPSGSGKTSLLNSMARRLYSTLRTRYRSSGRMLFNSAVATEFVIRSICSYVPQNDDGLLPFLTVRETLRFAARLRLPSYMSKEEKIRRADSTLLKLSLKDCADIIIGSELVKGISGGERRRVTIAIQILTDPRVLLLDEPTSGLDAFTASSIVDVLQGLASEGRTIILTLHQTRSNLFSQFGTMLLLARDGDMVYSGQASGMLSHFDSLGFDCPENTNPADFALDLISVDLQETAREAATREKVAKLVSSWTNAQGRMIVEDSLISTPATLGSMVREKAKIHVAVPILIHRGIINLCRQPELVTGRLSQLLGLGIVLTAFFAPLRNDYYSVQSRVGYVQEISSIYFVGMLNSIAMFPYERAVFYREDDDNTYPLEAFFFYYSALEIPMELIASIMFSLLTVLAVGLPRTAGLFFLMSYNAFCVVSCGESLGIVFLTLFSHTGLAVSIMSVVLALAIHLGGIISLSVPAFLKAVNHVSPVKWQVGNLISYSLRGIEFTCTESQRLPNGQCPIQNGEQVLALYKLDVSTGKYALGLGAITVGYRLLAYLVLKARRTHWRDFLER